MIPTGPHTLQGAQALRDLIRTLWEKLLGRPALAEYRAKHPYEDAWREALNFAIDTLGAQEAQDFLATWRVGAWDEIDEDWPAFEHYLRQQRTTFAPTRRSF